MLRKRIFQLLLFTLCAFRVEAYDIVDRFKVTEDRLETFDMLDPHKHDFIFETSVLLNKDVFDFIDEAEAVSKTSGSDTEKLAAAQAFLRKYDKTEQNIRVKTLINIPLPSMTFGTVKLVPNLRVADVTVGALVGVRTSTFTTSQAAQYLGSDVPDAIVTKLSSGTCNPGNGVDIVQFIISNCGLSSSEISQAQAYVGKYFTPTDSTIPDVYAYAKAEVKSGFYFDYFLDDHFFGKFNLYGLGRADYTERVSADSLSRTGDVADLGEELNTTINAALDYSIGYRNGNLMSFASVEELKVARISDKEDEGYSLNYGDSARYRLHSEYKYQLSFFSLKPFLGVHARSGYDFSDGLYTGSDVGFHTWGDRIGVNFRGMIDKEHITLSPTLNLWLISVNYMLKSPIKSEVDGVKPATMHSANVRFSF